MACLVGMTCSWKESEEKHLLHHDYITAVSSADIVPVIIPAAGTVSAEYYYEALDGFVFSGGGDIDPLYFGEEPLFGLGEITPHRDSFELALAKLALQGQKPVLGICRGLQLINVAAGGSVHQDIRAITAQKHYQQAPGWYGTHGVDIADPSCLRKCLDTNTLRVNSFHHQAINTVGKNLRAVAWSKDGLIEAVEATDSSKYVIGVQWHPECAYNKDDFSKRLFASFTEEVRRSVSLRKQG